MFCELSTRWILFYFSLEACKMEPFRRVEGSLRNSFFKKTASPRFLIQGFPVGLEANVEAGTWEPLGRWVPES